MTYAFSYATNLRRFFSAFPATKDKPSERLKVIGRPIAYALTEVDGNPAFLEKALTFIEEYGNILLRRCVLIIICHALLLKSILSHYENVEEHCIIS